MNSNPSPCELCASPGGAVLWQNGSCRVVRVDEPDYPGFCRVILARHVREMTDLAPAEREAFMAVVFGVEAAIRETMRADKMNLASLGNMTPHLHWHVVPRFRDDRHFPASDLVGAATRSGRTCAAYRAPRARSPRRSPRGSAASHVRRRQPPPATAPRCRSPMRAAARSGSTRFRSPTSRRRSRWCSRRCALLEDGEFRRARAPQVPRADARQDRLPAGRAARALLRQDACRCRRTTATPGAPAARCSSAMEAGYRLALEAARAGDGELAALVALVSQRIVRYVGAQMLFHAVVYRRFEPDLWSRLHRDYVEAERAGIAEERVKDSLESEEGHSSVARGLRAGGADAGSVPVGADRAADGVRRDAAAHVGPQGAGARGRAEDAPPLLPLAVDLNEPIGARPLAARGAGRAPPHARRRRALEEHAPAHPRAAERRGSGVARLAAASCPPLDALDAAAAPAQAVVRGRAAAPAGARCRRRRPRASSSG